MRSLLVFMLFISFQLFANTTLPKEQTELDIKLILISAMSETVHSLQQERGASCGYISSESKNFKNKLITITYNSDAKIDFLHTFINKNQKVLAASFSKEDHATMDHTFKDLYGVREDVKTLKIDFAKTYSKYTQSIAFMLMNIANLVDSFEDTALTDKLYSYSTILMYKESIGQKRAALSALFSQKVFSKEIFEYFLTSNTTEKIYLKNFLHNANDETKTNYLNAFKNPAIQEVSRYEALALEKLSGKEVVVDPKLWFEQVTTKIDLVQSVEHKIFADALLRAEEVAKASLLALTPEEKRWIEHHVVKIGVEQWTPVIFSNSGKDIDGISGDFTKKIIEKTGLKIEVINANWDTLLKDFKEQKLDLLPATYYTAKRATFGLYSDGYFKMKDAIYVKEENQKIRSLKDLTGDTLAIPKGYGTIDKLRQHFPEIKLVLTKDLDDSINRVLNGRVTAFYEGQIAAEAKLDAELIKGIKPISVKAFSAPNLYFFSRTDEPILHSIIQKGLQSISYQEKNKIISKWGKLEQAVNLTPVEQRWIEKHEPIAYSYDPDYAPFEWTNEVGLHSGIIADILKIVSTKTDISFVAIPAKTWTQALQLIKSGEVEMLSAVAKSSERQKYLNFTSQSIYSNSTLLLAHSDDNAVYLDILDGMSDKKIGIVKKTALGAYLKRTYPQLIFVEFPSTKAGFEGMRNKSIDIFAINAATAQYFIKRKGYEDLKIALKLDYVFDLKIALTKEMPPEVISILDKALESISAKEIADIYYKWTHVSVETKIDWVLIAQITGVIFIILLFVLYNNYKLQWKVKEKTADIERQKDELKALSEGLEIKVQMRTKELQEKSRFITTVIDSQENFVLTSDGKHLKSVNKAFLEFYDVANIDAFQKRYGNCICETFNTNASDEYIQKRRGEEGWLEYVYHRPNKIHKASIIQDGIEHIFTITASKILFNNKESKVAVFSDVTELENAKKEVEYAHQHTKDSIEYASLIQGALIPDKNIFSNYFQDYFSLWQPKDTVGGDIYLFDALRNEDECLLMVIDCTGHGVPGAFVTMLVKAIERQIVAHIKNSDEIISPANLLGVFNRSMKHLLKQEDVASISNVGFDGGIIYYNKSENILKYAGAGIPLFYLKEGALNVIKGDRYSVGYKKCAMDYVYSDYTIDTQEGMKFYITTDGYLDQNGGEHGFPFGKKKFQSIIKEHHDKEMQDQEKIFMSHLVAYAGEFERNDDVAMIGFTI